MFSRLQHSKSPPASTRSSTDLTDTSTITRDGATLQGTLKQKGLFSTYKPYHFKLNTQEGTLTKYKRNSKSVVETFVINDAQNVQIMPGMNLSGKQNTIAVFRKGHSPVILHCEHDADYFQWLKALENCNSGKEDSNTHKDDQTTSVTDVELKRDNMLSALEAVLDASVISDDRGYIVGFNRAAEHMFGWKKDEIVTKNVKVLMPEAYANYHDTFLENYYQTGHKKLIGVPRNIIAKHRDGTTFSVQISLGEVSQNHRAPSMHSSDDEMHTHTGEIAFIAMFRSIGQEVESTEEHALHKDVPTQFEDAKEKMHSVVRDFLQQFKLEVQEQHNKLDTKVTTLQNKLEILEKENNRLKTRMKYQMEQEKLLEDELFILQETTHRLALRKILRNDKACSLLREFCMNESREYLNAVNFFLETDEFYNKHLRNIEEHRLVDEEACTEERNQITVDALQIFQRYIMCEKGVQSPIPISDAMVQYLQNHLSSPTLSMYLPVQTEMIDIIRKQILKGFMSRHSTEVEKVLKLSETAR